MNHKHVSRYRSVGTQKKELIYLLVHWITQKLIFIHFYQIKIVILLCYYITSKYQDILDQNISLILLPQNCDSVDQIV